jgi:stage V sporulation protein R
MNKTELQRLVQIEDRIYQIAEEEGLEFCDIEFDIIPDQKMLEIMAYRIPGNISNWKYGRDYERLRTIHERVRAGLPLEVVINSDPSRAYLMKDNTLAMQAMVMAHVVGHVAFFTMNKYFIETNKDIIPFMSAATKRFNEYERKYSIEQVERIIDAGHSIQFHSSPFDNETESEKRERIYEQKKTQAHTKRKAEFDDIVPVDESYKDMDIALFNQRLWKSLKLKTPVEPTEDLLRYIIDNSSSLENWQKDILEVLRREGRYFWPQMRTKYMNEGFATYWHEKIMKRLFDEELLNMSDHAQYNYSNSLVKAAHRTALNPYLVGSKMWEDIVDRWDKGRHGRAWTDCDNRVEKEAWDTHDMKGKEKMFEILRTHTDWFFMKGFLTADLVDEMELYIFVERLTPLTKDLVITKQRAEKIAEMIIASFTHNHIPKVEVTDGNYNQMGHLFLTHRWSGANLKQDYCKKTLQHIATIWGKNCYLETKDGPDKRLLYKVERKAKLGVSSPSVSPSVSTPSFDDSWSTITISN